MPRKPKTVPTARIPDIQASLKKKAAAPKTITLQELINSLAQPIQEMLDAGYSYEDVADVFKGHGVELAASGIKSFHKKAVSQQTTETTNTSDSVTQSNETVIESSTPIESPTPQLDESPQQNSSPSPSESGKKSDGRTTKTHLKKKTASPTNPQFNVTDRQNI